MESPHYQSLRRGITRGVRALEAEYAAEEAEREQRFQEFWSERYLTREFRTKADEIGAFPNELSCLTLFHLIVVRDHAKHDRGKGAQTG